MKETFSPVAGDTTIWTVLATAMYQNWVCEAIDVEAAFLNADLEDEVFVEVPEGFSGGDVNQLTQVFKLKKAVYGIVQAPQCWTKAFAKSLIEKEMQQSKVDPCLFMLRRSDGSIAGLLVNYVDDGIIVGTPEAVRAIKSMVKATFTITELGPLKNIWEFTTK